VRCSGGAPPRTISKFIDAGDAWHRPRVTLHDQQIMRGFERRFKML
jgi:hypothetical protein